MPIAIFNITNETLSTAVSLAIFVLVVIWLATVVYTYLDARRRIEDPFLVGCATVASFFPFIGTAVYAILRPPDLISDARERELDIRTAELRLRHLTEQSCPNCNFPIDKNFLRCPACERHLKDPCETCNRPVDPRWALCPYCETELPGKQRRSKGAASARGGDEGDAAEKVRRRAGGDSAQRSGASGSSKGDGSGARGRSKTTSKQGGTAGSRSKSGSKSKAAQAKQDSDGSRSQASRSGSSGSAPADRSDSSGKAPAKRDR